MPSHAEIHTRIVRASLDPTEALAFVSAPEAGGTALFCGTVRSPNGGEQVDHLVYEAWDDEAEAAMERIARRVTSELGSVRAFVEHRTGRVEVGEPSVVVAVSAAHRDEAFRACRAIIDEVKATAPIWKKEITPSGSTWVGMPTTEGASA